MTSSSDIESKVEPTELVSTATETESNSAVAPLSFAVGNCNIWINLKGKVFFFLKM